MGPHLKIIYVRLEGQKPGWGPQTKQKELLTSKLAFYFVCPTCGPSPDQEDHLTRIMPSATRESHSHPLPLFLSSYHYYLYYLLN
jgi:hypothetical protein